MPGVRVPGRATPGVFRWLVRFRGMPLEGRGSRCGFREPQRLAVQKQSGRGGAPLRDCIQDGHREPSRLPREFLQARHRPPFGQTIIGANRWERGRGPLRLHRDGNVAGRYPRVCPVSLDPGARSIHAAADGRCRGSPSTTEGATAGTYGPMDRSGAGGSRSHLLPFDRTGDAGRSRRHRLAGESACLGAERGHTDGNSPQHRRGS